MCSPPPPVWGRIATDRHGRIGIQSSQAPPTTMTSKVKAPKASNASCERGEAETTKSREARVAGKSVVLGEGSNVKKRGCVQRVRGGVQHKREFSVVFLNIKPWFHAKLHGSRAIFIGSVAGTETVTFFVRPLRYASLLNCGESTAALMSRRSRRAVPIYRITQFDVLPLAKRKTSCSLSFDTSQERTLLSICTSYFQDNDN